jgi:hypothetical protein
LSTIAALRRADIMEYSPAEQQTGAAEDRIKIYVWYGVDRVMREI